MGQPICTIKVLRVVCPLLRVRFLRNHPEINQEQKDEQGGQLYPFGVRQLDRYDEVKISVLCEGKLPPGEQSCNHRHKNNVGPQQSTAGQPSEMNIVSI